MNVGSVQASQAIPFYQLVTAKYSSEKLSVPVAGGKHVYAHFEHVRGVPAESGGTGVPIVKLKILDTLIKQIGKLQGELQSETAGPSTMPSAVSTGELSGSASFQHMVIETDDLDSEKLDGMISEYQNRLHALLTNEATPYTHNFLEPGLFINMVA